MPQTLGSCIPTQSDQESLDNEAKGQRMFKKCFPVAFAAACLCFAGCSSDDTAPRPSSITSEDTAPSTRANLPTTPTSPIGGTLEIESEGFAVGVSDYSISNPRTIGDTYVVDVSVKTKQGEGP